jgi:hypothetical protein
MFNNKENSILDLVNKMINAGKKEISLPDLIMKHIGPETIKEINDCASFMVWN